LAATKLLKVSITLWINIMLCQARYLSLAALLLLMSLNPCMAGAESVNAATIVVATADSSERSKAHADLVGDGSGDQEEINAAVKALPAVGGTVMLMEGTYDIRKVADRLGGVLISRSHVTLARDRAARRS
jgi:hypothetical protein